jgi:hypothetical protein
LAICVTEAVNNAIVHAHRHDARKVIVIHFERKADGLQVRVLDEGRGFCSTPLCRKTVSKTAAEAFMSCAISWTDLKSGRMRKEQRSSCSSSKSRKHLENCHLPRHFRSDHSWSY